MTGQSSYWNSHKSLLSKLLLTALSLGLALLIGEIGVRALFPVAAQLYAFDPERHYTFQPGARKLHQRHPDNGGERFLVSINPHGFRGENFSLERSPSQKRLAVYGDSFVAGEYSQLEATFCRQLEKKLGDSWEVINAGVTGYGLDQSLLKMESELDLLEPDAVLLVVCSENDSIDLIRNKLFETGPDGGLVRTGAMLSQSMKRKLEPPFALHPRNSILAKTAIRAGRGLHAKSSRDASATPESVCRDFLGRSQDQYDEFQVERRLEVSDIIEDFYDIDWALNPDSEASQFKERVTRGILRKFKDTAAQQKLPFSIVVVPSIRDTVENDDIFAEGLRAMPGYDPARLSGHYEALAAELAIPCLNLFQPFVEHGAGELYFREHDSHWNDRGQQVAAGLVFESFEKRNHLALTAR